MALLLTSSSIMKLGMAVNKSEDSAADTLKGKSLVLNN